MADTFSEIPVPFSGLSESDLIELFTDKINEFQSHTDVAFLQTVDDDSFLLTVPEDFSVEVQGLLFFEDMGYLSYMDGDDIIPLYLDSYSLAFDWQDTLGLRGLRTLLFTLQVFCDTLFQLTEDSWYMSLFGDLNSILWALTDFNETEF